MKSQTDEAFANLLRSSNGVADAVRKATQEALAEHGKAGRAVPIWRDEKVVWVTPDHEGNLP